MGAGVAPNLLKIGSEHIPFVTVIYRADSGKVSALRIS